MPFQTGFIAIRLLDPKGQTPLAGVTVKIKASVPFVTDSATDSILISEKGITLTTDSDGRAVVEVPASNSTGLDPAGVTYNLSANTRPRPFTVAGIFVLAGVTVQAADVAPAPDAPQYAVQVTRAEFDDLVDLVGAGGGGGGAVSSVNTKTGDVVLVAADVGAETPTGAQTKATAARDAAIAAAATDATTKVAAASTTDRDRANHTGTQTSATISDFAEAAQDAVAAALQGVTGATVTYNDAANTITITGVGDPETMRDVIGVALVGVGNITVAVNDAADTITISTTATANSTDAALRDRSTHTGTQSADTLTDGTTNKALLATERTKLAGVATGATANASDAQLRDRSTHTGTQSLDTTTDSATRLALTAAERTKIATGLVGKSARIYSTTTATSNATVSVIPMGGFTTDDVAFFTRSGDYITVVNPGLYTISFYGQVSQAGTGNISANIFVLLNGGSASNVVQEAGLILTGAVTSRLAGAAMVRTTGPNATIGLGAYFSATGSTIGTNNSKDVGIALAYIGS